MANKEVANKNAGSVPVSMADIEKYAGAGFEEASADSYAIPFLQILQKMSDETDPENAKYLNGAKAGMFANLTTGKLFDGKKGINVIPCYHKTEYQEWAEFGTGSGRPENIYPADSDILKKTTKDGARDRLPNGNYILNVHQNFVLIVAENGHAESALISMSASQSKVAKKWLSLQMSQTMSDDKGIFTPASFAYAYKLTSVLNSGKGNQWYGYSISLAGEVTNSDLYVRAKDFHNTLEANNK